MKSFILLRSVYRRIFKEYGIKEPILIYQMGKVGSRTVYRSLKALGLGVPVYHCHLLNDLDKIEDAIIKSRANPKETLAEIRNGRKLRSQIFEGKYKKWNLISLVRDPIKRNISAFFQNITEVIPDVYEKYNNNSISIDEIINSFIHEYDHNAPLYWFDSQLKDVFDIDVFASEFPKAAGYEVYDGEKVRLLLMRLENLTACVQDAIEVFFGIQDFKLINVNIGNQKKYNKIYRDFLENANLPANYIDLMYDSKFCKHFYNSDEIEEFRKSWAK